MTVWSWRAIHSMFVFADNNAIESMQRIINIVTDIINIGVGEKMAAAKRKGISSNLKNVAASAAKGGENRGESGGEISNQ